MSRFHSYIRTAQQMLTGYNGSLPFAHFAKQFFAGKKKYGSTDRRQISTLCYHYFRAAKALVNLPEEDKYIAATFLCETHPNKLLEQLHPVWNEKIQWPLPEKIALLNNAFDAAQLFPFQQQLSNTIDKKAFAYSFLTQPDLFLRLRPEMEEKVKAKLTRQGIDFRPVNEHCLALANGTKTEEAIALNKEAVVQDYSSQQTGDILKQFILNHLPKINCWDCCAASGGKSLMLHDLRPDAALTVSDLRPSILHNLQHRFQQAGIRKYQSFTADVAKQGFQLPGRQMFNFIVADVPCTGSGTWARTPEQSYFFKEEKITQYALLQYTIAANALQALQPGGYLAYITCSVFRQENEAVIEKLLQPGRLKLIHQQYLRGYHYKADTLFIAILK